MKAILKFDDDCIEAHIRYEDGDPRVELRVRAGDTNGYNAYLEVWCDIVTARTLSAILATMADEMAEEEKRVRETAIARDSG